MASGWAKDGAVQDQIDDTIADAVTRARARMPAGESGTHCADCGEEIADARRRALPGVRTCVACQSERDRRPASIGFNRRGNKDSQLRAFPQINESGVCGSELLTIPLRLVLAYCRFMIDITSIRERYTALSQHLDERGRRVFAATEAKTAGYGGIAALSRATGIAASTIGRGLKELVAAEVLDPGRVRRPGGGGKKRVTQDTTLLGDLLALVEPDARGDPMSP